MSEMKFRMIAVKDAREGMRCDLEADPFASDSSALGFELQTIMQVPISETADCTLVLFDFDGVGMPPNHLLKVLIEDEYLVRNKATGAVFYRGTDMDEAYREYDSHEHVSLYTRHGEFPLTEVVFC